jgi:hypothetical protein
MSGCNHHNDMDPTRPYIPSDIAVGDLLTPLQLCNTSYEYPL